MPTSASTIITLDRRAAIIMTLVDVRLQPVQYASPDMSPTWIWMQVAIVIFVLVGIVIAITKLA